MSKNPSTTPSTDGAMEFAEKLTFLEQSIQRLYSLEKKREDIQEEIRAALKVVFSFIEEPSVLTENWMKRVDEAISYYEDPLKPRREGEVTAVDHRSLEQAGIR